MKYILSALFFLTVNSSLKAQQSFLDLESARYKIYTSIDDGMAEPDQVVVLNLRQTEIIAVPRELSRFRKLRYLNIMKNGITELPAHVFTSTELREIAGRENKIERIDKKIGRLKRLVWLDLSKNKLTHIPNLGKLDGLEMLALNENSLTVFPEGITDLKHLKTLNLDKNQITLLPDDLKRQSTLEHFSAASNQISSVGTLFQSKSLLSVHLGNNNLTILPEKWQCDSLKSLIINNNNLSKLPETLGRLNKLELLDISHNSIDSLPDDLSQLKSLQTLIATGTQISPNEQERIRLALPANCLLVF